jgi:hypothetical protein
VNISSQWTDRLAEHVFGICRSELYLRMASGQLLRKKIGKATRIPTASLIELVDNLPTG